MTDSDEELRGHLLARIKARRASINSYIRLNAPRTSRLTNISIISSAIVTVLTAGPAFGGDAFTTGVAAQLGLPSDTVVWRVLCLGAVVLSIVAALSTNAYRSSDVSTRLIRAEACHAELEALEALVEFGQLPITEAVKLYQQYVAGVPYIEEVAEPAPQPAHG